MEYDPVTEQELLWEMRRVRGQMKRKRLLWGLLIWAALAAAAGWFIFDRYFILAVVRGPSMEDTVQSNSVVLCRRDDGFDPQNGDVILISKGDHMSLRRVAAHGGDQLMLSAQGNLWINGLQYPADAADMSAAGDMLYRPVTVPEGEYFVLGDSPELAVDSRSGSYGTVKREQVIGRLTAVVWPPYQMADAFNQHVIQPVLKLFH